MSDFQPDPLPPSSSVTDQWSLPTDFNYPSRKVNAGAAALEMAGTGYDPSEWGVLGRGPGGNTGASTYRGRKLVDRNGDIKRDAYSPKEAYGFLASLGRADRIALTNELYQRGAYDGRKPSATRLGSADIGAAENYLLTMNTFGVTAESGLPLFREQFPVGGIDGTAGGMGGGKARATTNPDDVKMAYKKTWADLIGHSPTKEDEAKFANFYQQMELQGTAPSLGTSASNQIQKNFGGQVQSYKAGGLAEIMDSMIASWGT